ncbi:MAG: hypothetical protein AB8G77_24695 [Rhodothermales bacterium]
MHRRGYLLRFIDLGLIILFGFLMISDITVISQVTLPGKSDENVDSSTDESQIYMGVLIQNDGQYEVVDLADRTQLHVGIKSSEELQFVLKTLDEQQRAAGKTLNLLIEPAPASHMQKLVDVLDVCERLSIQKNINTEAVFQQVAASEQVSQ